jgi:hypothetical protein
MTATRPNTAAGVPRTRWNWTTEALDNPGHPVVMFEDNGCDALGATGAPVAEGQVDTLANLPDPYIPSTWVQAAPSTSCSFWLVKT